MKTALILVLAAGAANADPLVWDNGVADGNFTSSQYDTAYPFDSQVADDFVLAADTNVTKVHWDGGYWNGSPIASIPFNIFIYADDGSGAAPTLPDTEIAGYYGVTPTAVVDPVNPAAYVYDYELDTPFQAEGGIQYWISIQAVTDFPPQWGWTSTFGGNHGTTAVQGFPLLGHDYWSANLTEDMAFQLYGVPVPAPASIALLGLGALIRRR